MDIKEIQSMGKYGYFKEMIEILENYEINFDRSDLTTFLVESYNQYAIKLIEENKISLALENLIKAETFTEKPASLRAKTFNNIAICYQKQGKPSIALKYLEKALLLHPSGDVHLNFCAVFSMEGKHQLAFEEAMYAIVSLQDELFQSLYDGVRIDQSKFETLAISFHNLAVELEFLKKVPQAIFYYRKSVEVLEKYTKSSKIREKLRNELAKALRASVTPTKKFNDKSPLKKRLIIKDPQHKSPLTRLQNSPVNSKTERIKNSEMPGFNTKTQPRKFVSSGISKAKMLKIMTLDNEIVNKPDFSKTLDVNSFKRQEFSKIFEDKQESPKSCTKSKE